LRTKYRHTEIGIFENSNIGIYRGASLQTLTQAYTEGSLSPRNMNMESGFLANHNMRVCREAYLEILI
jgi:hypothetical protein